MAETVASDTLVAVDTLRSFLAALYTQAGMPPDDAAFTADALVTTNLWGLDSHGVLRAPVYLKRVLSKAVNPKPNIKPLRGGAALEVIDGDDGMGFIVGRAAMHRAIELANTYNIAAVGTVRSNHFGAAGLYAKQAADAGMIGIVMTSVRPNMVAPGGSKPIAGNNPIAIAVPMEGEFPFIFDISLSNAAGGKILLAIQRGESIPEGWATDKQGRPTTDPEQAFGGFFLPIGGHKGLGLAYVVDILSGVLTGGAFQYGVKSMYRDPDAPSLTGHFMIVIKPDVLVPPDEFSARMAEFRQTVKESPMWDEHREMMLPGEIEFGKMQQRLAEGVPVPPKLLEELNTLAQELGIDQRL